MACQSCDRENNDAPATAPARRTVASLVPAATDVITGMGAGDHLVAVSNWDADRPEIRGLPRVGDYQTVDWEKLAALKPAVMVIQIKPDRMPAGFSQRAAGLHIQLVNVAIDRLDDVIAAYDALGAACDEPEKSAAAKASLRARLDAVAARAAGNARVPAMIVVGAGGLDLAGPGTFLDDLLTLAGGENVARPLNKSYPSIDREMLSSFRPAVIFQLMPGASPQEREKAAAVWASVPSLPAVRDGKVVVIDDWFALLPGSHVAELAERFSQAMMPPPTTRP